MRQYKTILYEIIFFLDWREYTYICNQLMIDLKFNVFFKYNNSLKNFENCDKYIKYVNWQDNKNKNTMDCASFYGQLEVVKFLHKNGGKCTHFAICHSSENGFLETVKYLHSIGNECHQFGIYWASYGGNLEIVKFLHKNYKGILKKTTIRDSIVVANIKEHSEIVKYLKSI
jgi:ankyrin repeat protein